VSKGEAVDRKSAPSFKSNAITDPKLLTPPLPLHNTSLVFSRLNDGYLSSSA